MANILRQIVAGPRARHPEAGLDLCYVTDNIIATSGPSGTYPQLAYRNPLKQLVKFLDDKHGDQWAIWEFRAEGTGYPDEEVYNRIHHYPWPDHHPPPFALVPLIMASMRNWLKEGETQEVSERINLAGSNVETDTQKPEDATSNGTGVNGPPETDTESTTTPTDYDTTEHSASPIEGSSEVPSGSITDASSIATSETSTKRKKNVSWRESTILPPKEDRPKLPTESESHPSKTKNTVAKDNGKATAKPKPSERVVVVHCKAGKGRSGTVSCSYLISQEGWTVKDALQRFTERRMRPGFGAGISIPSQLRWISYVDRWTRHGKHYTERPVEILEVHVWGLRDRVKVCVDGFKDQGRKIESIHTFTDSEREMIRGDTQKAGGFAWMVNEMIQEERARRDNRAKETQEAVKTTLDEEAGHPQANDAPGTGDVVFRPAKPIVLDTNDVNIDFERRNKGISSVSMITSVAHVWFNAFFEGDGPERDGIPRADGVFAIEWDRMDGIKGSSRKGTRAFDKLAVVWRSVVEEGTEIREPGVGDAVKEGLAADWKGRREGKERDLGTVAASAESLVKS